MCWLDIGDELHRRFHLYCREHLATDPSAAGQAEPEFNLFSRVEAQANATSPSKDTPWWWVYAPLLNSLLHGHDDLKATMVGIGRYVSKGSSADPKKEWVHFLAPGWTPNSPGFLQLVRVASFNARFPSAGQKYLLLTTSLLEHLMSLRGDLPLPMLLTFNGSHGQSFARIAEYRFEDRPEYREISHFSAAAPSEIEPGRFVAPPAQALEADFDAYATTLLSTPIAIPSNLITRANGLLDAEDRLMRLVRWLHDFAKHDEWAYLFALPPSLPAAYGGIASAPLVAYLGPGSDLTQLRSMVQAYRPAQTLFAAARPLPKLGWHARFGALAETLGARRFDNQDLAHDYLPNAVEQLLNQQQELRSALDAGHFLYGENEWTWERLKGVRYNYLSLVELLASAWEFAIHYAAEEMADGAWKGANMFLLGQHVKNREDIARLLSAHRTIAKQKLDGAVGAVLWRLLKCSFVLAGGQCVVVKCNLEHSSGACWCEFECRGPATGRELPYLNGFRRDTSERPSSEHDRGLYGHLLELKNKGLRIWFRGAVPLTEEKGNWWLWEDRTNTYEVHVDPAASGDDVKDGCSEAVIRFRLKVLPGMPQEGREASGATA